MAHAKNGVLVGTSGWIYKSWAKAFYPADLRPADQLAYYAAQFPTVEINATFYRLPTPEAVCGWKEQSPPGFVFAVKGSRAITHFKKLLPGAKSFPLFFERVPLLGRRLGPVLWQLPGSFHKNVERLDAFLSSLPKKGARRHAVEFRHESWLSDDVFDVLRRHRAAFVSVSSLGMPTDLTVTADFAYVRFHGLKGGAAHDYTEKELRPWAEHLRQCAKKGMQAYAYFNNDVNTRAPANARMMMEMLGECAVLPVEAKCRKGNDRRSPKSPPKAR